MTGVVGRIDPGGVGAISRGLSIATPHTHQLSAAAIYKMREVLPQFRFSYKLNLEEGASRGNHSQGRRGNATVVWQYLHASGGKERRHPAPTKVFSDVLVADVRHGFFEVSKSLRRGVGPDGGAMWCWVSAASH